MFQRLKWFVTCLCLSKFNLYVSIIWVVFVLGTETEESDEFSVLRTPLRALSGHNGVVIAADWLPGGEQVRTQNLLPILKPS